MWFQLAKITLFFTKREACEGKSASCCTFVAFYRAGRPWKGVLETLRSDDVPFLVERNVIAEFVYAEFLERGVLAQ